MKLVKKFLRFYPILFVAVAFLSSFFIEQSIYKNEDVINFTFDDYRDVDNVSLNIFFQNLESVNLVNYSLLYSTNALGFQDICNNISYLLTNGDLGLDELGQYTQIGNIIYTLVYELYLSFAFICFDLFNWFLSLGRNLLKKGGKYDD